MAEIEQTLTRVEQAVLPTIASMLDALIDAAQGARPGIDGLRYSTDIRSLAEQANRASREIGDILAALRDSSVAERHIRAA